MKIQSLLVALILAVLAGCASITPQEISAVTFAVPDDYQAQIKTFMAGRLKDPYTAMYEFGSPRKAFVQEGIAVGNRKIAGLTVPTSINARNSYGGYIGAKIYYFMFADGHLYDVTDLLIAGRGKFLE